MFGAMHPNKFNSFGPESPNIFEQKKKKLLPANKWTREKKFVLYLAPLYILEATFLSSMHRKSKFKKVEDEKGEKTYPRSNGL